MRRFYTFIAGRYVTREITLRNMHERMIGFQCFFIWRKSDAPDKSYSVKEGFNEI